MWWRAQAASSPTLAQASGRALVPRSGAGPWLKSMIPTPFFQAGQEHPKNPKAISMRPKPPPPLTPKPIDFCARGVRRVLFNEETKYN